MTAVSAPVSPRVARYCPTAGKHKPVKAKSRLGRFSPDFAEMGRRYENKQEKAEGLPCSPLAGHSGRQRRPHKALQGFWGLQRKPTFRGCSNFSLADLGVAVFERKIRQEKEMTQMPTPKNKRKFALWLYPETLEKIGQLYTADDCRSKSEFIEKAVQFYIDHLTAEDQRSMLPNAMLSSMKSIVAESDNRICRLLFKLAVQLAVTMNVVAANSEIDDVSLERLKGECVKEVKRLNGNFTFKDANDWQKG